MDDIINDIDNDIARDTLTSSAKLSKISPWELMLREKR